MPAEKKSKKSKLNICVIAVFILLMFCCGCSLKEYIPESIRRKNTSEPAVYTDLPAFTAAPVTDTPETTDIPVRTSEPVSDVTEAPATEEPENKKDIWVNARQLFGFYDEIALHAEFGTQDGRIHKWTEPISLYIRPSQERIKYLDYISDFLDNLNKIEGFPGIRIAEYSFNSGIVLDFVSESKMSGITASYGETAIGFTTIYWNSKSNAITSAEIYILNEKSATEDEIRHALLEEITQSLGLINDSSRYEDSIFYIEYSTTPALSQTDWQVISIHYSDEIRCGMNKEEVKNVFERHIDK